ncbi:MAG: hypothetical protein EHM58_16405 [Ignavibacteriae bacterium]|nr:MAG: hypothetical protein EHM58_16405 [Ignavibacteriota bacterium]
MKTYFIFFLIITAVIFVQPIHAQSQNNDKKLNDIFYKAIYEYDHGSMEKAVELLEECLDSEPDNAIFMYELASANYMLKNYDISIKICKKLIKHKDSNFMAYQLLGNAYDFKGNYEKALKTYDDGLKRFPNSARLYFEKAITYYSLDKINNAILNWETAVDLEPGYASSYYFLTKVFSESSEPIWSIIYGEIFLNIEPGTKRSLDISKILYDTYKRAISFEGDKVNIKMSKQISQETLPFTLNYELTQGLCSIAMNKTFSIKSLIELRKEFAKVWSDKYSEKFPLEIVNRHNKLIENGHFEAYNYWLFSEGDKEEFNTWFEKNEQKFHDFGKWTENNPFSIDSTNYFSMRVIIKLCRDK